MQTIIITKNYCSYKKGQIIEMPFIDAEALMMAGVAVLEGER